MASDNKIEGMLNYCINQSEESKKVAEMLIKSKNYNSAVNRIYYSIHYKLMAAALKEEKKITRPNDILNWFNTHLIKTNIIPYDFFIVAKNALKDRLAADYEPMTSYTEQDLTKKLKNLNDFLDTLDQHLSGSVDLVPMAMEYLRKAIYWKDNKGTPQPNIEILKKYYNFFVYTLFSKSDKAKETLKEYSKNLANKKLEGSIEVRVDDALSEHPNMAVELKKLFNELANYKIGAPIIEGYTPPNPTPPPSPAPKQEQSSQPIEAKIDTPAEEKTDAEQKKEVEPKDKKPETPDNELILVPYDFTEKGNNAIEHALNIAEVSGADIKLLHLVKKEKETLEVAEKLKTIIADVEKKHNKTMGFLVRAGNIFVDITKISNELHASLVVMGTHGIKGMQKITGSYALKVITETKAPFMVIQEPPKNKTIYKVIFPVDHRKDTKKMFNQVKFLSQYYKLKFYIIKAEKFPTEAQKKNTLNNFVFAKSYFSQNNKEFETITRGDSGHFADNIIKYTKEVEADLILILTTKSISMGDYMMGAEEQKIIANPLKTPVMCINPSQPRSWYIGSHGG